MKRQAFTSCVQNIRQIVCGFASIRDGIISTSIQWVNCRPMLMWMKPKCPLPFEFIDKTPCTRLTIFSIYRQNQQSDSIYTNTNAVSNHCPSRAHTNTRHKCLQRKFQNEIHDISANICNDIYLSSRCIFYSCFRSRAIIPNVMHVVVKKKWSWQKWNSTNIHQN